MVTGEVLKMKRVSQTELHLRLIDLVAEFNLLTRLDPSLDKQLIALEKEYGLYHGYEHLTQNYLKNSKATKELLAFAKAEQNIKYKDLSRKLNK